MKIYYDITRFPDLSEHGLIPVNVVYCNRVWGGDCRLSVPSQEQLKRIANEFTAEGLPVCLDIEHVGFHTWESVSVLADIAISIKRYAPTLDIGFFNVPLVSWMDGAAAKPYSDQWQGFQSIHNRLAAVADICDTLYPSFYIVNEDYRAAAHAENNIIRIIKRYGKKTRAFLWHHYAEGSKQSWPIDLNLYRHRIESIKANGFDLVIWQRQAELASFDPSSEWFKIVCSYIERAR